MILGGFQLLDGSHGRLSEGVPKELQRVAKLLGPDAYCMEGGQIGAVHHPGPLVEEHPVAIPHCAGSHLGHGRSAFCGSPLIDQTTQGLLQSQVAAPVEVGHEPLL